MLGKDLSIPHQAMATYLNENKTYNTNAEGMRKIVSEISRMVNLPTVFLITVLRYEIDFPNRPDWMNTRVRNGNFVGVMQTGADNWYDCLQWVDMRGLPYKLPRNRADASIEQQIVASFLYFERYRDKARLAGKELTPVAYYLLHNQGPGAVAKGTITRAAFAAQSDALRPVLRQHFKIL